MLCLVLLVFGRVACALSAPSELEYIGIFDGQIQYNLNQSIRYFRDIKGNATLDDIQAKNIWRKGVGLENPQGPLNLGYSTDKIWIAIPIQYLGKKAETEWWLEVDRPLLELAELYLVDQHGQLLDTTIIDDKTPLHARELPFVLPVFKILLKKQEPVIAYLRISNDFSLHLPINLMSPIGYSEKIALEELVYGGFMGAMIIMMLYNFFMYLSVREVSFIWYIIYIALHLLFLILERAHGVVQLFGYVPYFLQKEVLTSYIWLSWFFAILMGRSFLDTKKNEPFLDKVMLVLLVSAVISIGVSFLVPLTVAIQWSVFSLILYPIVILWVAYTSLRGGNRVAKYFLLAWIMNLVGIALFAMAVTGYAP